jgi:serine phosphatase RsbU (regulator of sigma subunit)
VRRTPLLGWRRTLTGTAIGLASISIVTVWHVSHPIIPTLLYILCVSAATVIGGLWPGLATSFLSLVAFDYRYYPPAHSLSPGEFKVLGTYLAIALIITLMLNRVLSTRAQAVIAQERLAFLLDASEAVAASLDFRTALSHTARLSVPALADWCAIYTGSEDGPIEELEVSQSGSKAVLELRRRPPIHPSAAVGVGKVIGTATPEFYPRVSRELSESLTGQEIRFRFLRRDRMRSYLSVPIRSRGRAVGAIAVATGISRRRLGKAELALLLDLARRASAAVDNAVLFEGRDHIARTLQIVLLPRTIPEIPGIELAPRYRPVGVGLDVGGDFYDVFQTAPREWAVVTGDIAGKGPEAAALTGVVRHTLRTLAPKERVPRRILAQLNQRLVSEEIVDRFVTLCYVRIRPSERGAYLTVATGGHPPPIAFRAGRTPERIGMEGTLLGVFPDPIVGERSMVLDPGDVVILYTDGLTEALGRELPEIDAIGPLVQRAAGLDAHAIADRMDAALRAVSGQQRDDICFVVIRARPLTIQKAALEPVEKTAAHR